MRRFLLISLTGTALLLPFARRSTACTCVAAIGSNARTEMQSASVVFQGRVIETKLLPQHPKMRGRRRWAIKFRVHEFWKGDPVRDITLYGLDPGTDCHGVRFQNGRDYLVYARQQAVRDYWLEDVFWYGWTDILKPDSTIFEPVACTPTGDLSDRDVRKALRKLGALSRSWLLIRARI